MDLDVRLPIGSMFTIVGILLVIYGLTSNPAIYKRSLGVNINLWWGLVLVVFGIVMLWPRSRPNEAAGAEPRSRAADGGRPGGSRRAAARAAARGAGRPHAYRPP
jgi:hypothetical protein